MKCAGAGDEAPAVSVRLRRIPCFDWPTCIPRQQTAMANFTPCSLRFSTRLARLGPTTPIHLRDDVDPLAASLPG
jgi:hypothetical protein